VLNVESKALAHWI